MPETPEQRLEALGLQLPKLSQPAGNLVGSKIHNGIAYVSGQLPLQDGIPQNVGKVGVSVSAEDAYQASRLAALNAIAQLAAATAGDLSRVSEIIKVSGFVNCAPDFTDIPFVVNGASDLFVAVFGDSGRHARFAVGVASLPRGVAVEIDVVAAITEAR